MRRDAFACLSSVCVWLSSEPQKSEPDNILPDLPVLFPAGVTRAKGLL